MEAAHSWFHPAWTKFMSFVDPMEIQTAKSVMMAPSGFIADDDIRYDYSLAGGAMMDTGPYTMGSLRLAFGGDVPVQCEKAELTPKQGMSKDEADVDQAHKMHFRFKNGGLGIARGSLKMPLSQWESPNWIEIVHNPVVANDQEAAEGHEVVRTRTVSLSFFVLPVFYHTIHVQDEYTLRKTGSPEAVVKRWTKKADRKAYSFKEAGVDQPGEVYWSTYRHCLEQSVNRVRGRETRQWFGEGDTIAMAKMLDMAYEAARLKMRPTSVFT